MDRGQIRAQARILLGETKEDFYKDSEINTQINYAALKVASETLANLTFGDALTVAGTQRYPLPSDMLALKDVQIIDGTVVNGVPQSGANTWPLVINSYDKFQAKNTTVYPGRPTVYRVEFGSVGLSSVATGDIWLLPIPNGAYTLRVVYYQKPTAMTDDAHVCELAEAAHEAVALRAAMILSRKSKDRNLITELAAMYNEHLTTVKKVLTLQDSTGPKYVRNVYR